MNCTTHGCSRTPTWEGTVSTAGAPASSISVKYCAICLTAMEKRAASSDIILNYWPLEGAAEVELESLVHHDYRVEYPGDGRHSFTVTHELCGGVLLVTQSVSVETLVLLPIKHAPDCAGYDFTKLV